jgi:hypothetical protein
LISRDGIYEGLDAPLGRVIERTAWEGNLAAHARKLQDAAAALRTKMRKRGADQLDRADKVGVDLVANLFVPHLLRGAHQAVARVADHDVDPAERGPGVIDDAADRGSPTGRARPATAGRHPRPSGRP